MPKLSARSTSIATNAAFWTHGLGSGRELPQNASVTARVSRQQGWYAALGYARSRHLTGAVAAKNSTEYTLKDVFNHKVDLSYDWFPLIDDDSVTSRAFPWARLSIMNRAHMIEEEQFGQMLYAERHNSFLQSCDPRESLYHGPEAMQNTHSSLALLRRLFLLPHTVKLINYIETRDVLGSFSVPFPPRGALHVDPSDIEQAKANCYPFPMMDPCSWRINHYECDPSLFDDEPVDIDAVLLWETTICPFISTYRYLEALVKEYRASVSDKYPGGIKYVPDKDMWIVMNSLHKAVIPLQLSKFINEFTIPVPVSLQETTNIIQTIDLLDLWTSGFTIMATAMYRLHHLHRLLTVAASIDDRCLYHQTQLFIDSHLPLWTFMTQYNTWTDAVLLAPVSIKDDMYASTVRHPLAPEALAAYAGAHVPPLTGTSVENVPLVYLLWPAATRWLVTVEEAPHLMSGLAQTGFVFRYSHEHTAIQNWDDPKTAFVAFFISKMGLVRSRIRSDHSIAKECFMRHPVMANILLNYFHVVQLGNIPGVMKRPTFFTRLRLWVTYRSSPAIRRSPDWVVEHCFKRFRYATRVGMHELHCFFLRMMPGLYQSLLSHPHQGIMYNQWAVSAALAGSFHRSRLESIPLTGPLTARDTHAEYIEMLLRRHYNSLLKHLNFASHHGVFSEFFERFLSSFYNSLLSRVEITLRAFNKEYAPKNSAAAANTTAPTEPKQSEQQQQQQPSPPVTDDEDYMRKLLEEMDDALAAGGGGGGSDETGQDTSDNPEFGNAPGYFDDDDEDDIDEVDELDETDEQANLDNLAMRFIRDAANSRSFAAESTFKTHDVSEDVEFDTRPSRTETKRQRKTHDATKLWSLSGHEMRAVHRTFLDNLLYVPQLDDPGNEETNELFKQMCFMVQFYHGARQRLPLMWLGYFGVAHQVIERMFMFYIYYLQALPYNRVFVMIRRMWLDFPQDCALLWRYLQYIRAFGTEQGIVLPVHVARQQLTAGEHAIFLSSKTARSEQHAKKNVGIFYYCPNCKSWAHQIAPEFSVYYTYSQKTGCFTCEAVRHSRMKVLVNAVSSNNRAAAGGVTRNSKRKRTAFEIAAKNRRDANKRVLVYRTDEWRSSHWDFELGCRICTSDTRRRVTGAVGNRIALSLLPRDLREKLLKDDTADLQGNQAIKDYTNWIKYGKLAMLFPLRQAEKNSLNKKGFGLSPNDGTDDVATALAEQHALASTNKGTKKGRGRKAKNPPPPSKRAKAKKAAVAEKVRLSDEEDEREEGATNEDEEDDDEDDNGGQEVLAPAVRELLSKYWFNDDRILRGTTDGMKHSDVLATTRPLIAAAASLPTKSDMSSVCGTPLVPVDLTGRIVSFPTQYTCVWRNYTACSICHIMMMAHEWRWSTERGYVCTLHRSTQPIDAEHMGLIWPARPASQILDPSPDELKTDEEIVEESSAYELQIQKRYYVTRPKQIMGIPGAWLREYGLRTPYEAMGLLRPRENGIDDDSAMDDRIFCCSECDKNIEPSDTVQASYYHDIVYVLRVLKSQCKVEYKRLCQRDYKNWARRQRTAAAAAASTTPPM